MRLMSEGALALRRAALIGGGVVSYAIDMGWSGQW